MPALNFNIAASNQERVSHPGRVLPLGLERGSVLRLLNGLLDACAGRARAMLEIGVGAGLYSRALHRSDLVTTVTDVLQHGLELPPPSHRFDLVLITGLMEFLEEAEEPFLELCNRVAPAGKLVAVFPRAGLFGKIHRLERRAFTGLDIRLIHPAWLEELANECGLSLETTRTPIPHRMVMAFEKLPVP